MNEMRHSFLRVACYVVRVVLTTPSAPRIWLLLSGFSFSAFRFPSSISRLPHFCPLLFAFCFLLFSLLIPPASVFAATTQEVEEALTCQCGCGLTVHNCNHLQCGFAVPAKQTILDLVSQGKTKEEITASFAARYGEKVLSAPTTSGFNLAAWITPFLAIAVGGVLIGVISLRWTRQRRQQEGDSQRTATAPDQYRERLKKELESFEG
jgi:cytochrome c-type biogenesis protein CcmH